MRRGAEAARRAHNPPEAPCGVRDDANLSSIVRV